MRSQCRIFLLLAGLSWLLLVDGCEPIDRRPVGAETDDPQYRRAQQLQKEGRYQEALAAYLKVIDERGGDAPESHLGAALIYQQYSPKDPIYAIYHFRRYLELEPNSRQADLVRQRIEAATRDFARTLPGQPLEGVTSRLDLMDKIDALQAENQQLKDQLAALGQTGVVSPAPGPPPNPVQANAGAAPEPATMHLVPLDTLPPAPVAKPAAARPPPAANTAASVPNRTAGRTHVVAPGETLYKIAQRYYGSGARWREILEANRDQLKSENAVRPGMQLRIP